MYTILKVIFVFLVQLILEVHELPIYLKFNWYNINLSPSNIQRILLVLFSWIVYLSLTHNKVSWTCT